MLDHPEAPMLLADALKAFDLAARWTGDRYFHLRRGIAPEVQDLGAYGELLMSKTRFSDIIDETSQSMGHLQQATRMWSEQRDETLVWSYRIEHRFDVGRQHDAEISIAYMLNAYRQHFGAHQSPQMVLLEQQGSTRRADDLETLLQAPVRFDQPSNGLVLDRGMIEADRALSNSNGAPSLDLRTSPSRLPTNLNEIIHELLVAALNSGDIAISKISGILDMSPRTMQRTLGKSGKSYSGILQETRSQLATNMLLGSTIPISEIGQTLGYSDSAHFTRAFRKLTGSTPSTVRNRGRLAA